MAEKKKGYVGQISNGGTQVINAPHAKPAKRGNSVIKKGGDLRTGK